MKPRLKLLRKLIPLFFLLALLATAGMLWAARESWYAALASRNGETWLNSSLVFVSLLVGLLIAGLGFAVIFRIRRSIEDARAGARRFANGDLEYRLSIPPSEELAGLAMTLNQMASQLDERIAALNQQRNEQEAILASMVEGVIAINREARILHLNTAAAKFLGSTPDLIIGRSMYEIIRNHELHKLVEKSLEIGIPTEGEVLLQGSAERSLQVHCTSLRSATGAGIGALMVLNDLTRIRRLERMRRDFVANVSHELKTPLTSIRGFVETLLDGALDEPEEARRFSKIIAKQVDRLQNIIEDLMSLSRVEQDVEQGQIPLKDGSIADVLQASIQAVGHAAAEKNTKIEIQCDPDWRTKMNAPLLEQVIVNLLDNAIKYSDPGKTISLSVTPDDDIWEIRVSDQGFGIDSPHIDRIFERFYRVDKARSRKAGGTGLGLAIVKHIVVAHGGTIKVESIPGTGSTFRVALPRMVKG